MSLVWEIKYHFKESPWPQLLVDGPVPSEEFKHQQTSWQAPLDWFRFKNRITKTGTRAEFFNTLYCLWHLKKKKKDILEEDGR